MDLVELALPGDHPDLALVRRGNSQSRQIVFSLNNPSSMFSPGVNVQSESRSEGLDLNKAPEACSSRFLSFLSIASGRSSSRPPAWRSGTSAG